ncbi:RDD family protein [Mobilicoccus massiliensis]|uniref:RDD family protein n=1 Tax=Mobilicoccus massiliensis TaxID=1522310 RepID=UPI00058BE38E|nr:RDD family protein [Mobilicoccus massiliensis]
MVERRDVGSWLSGPPTTPDDHRYPGERLGLPEHGPGSIAPFTRRIPALLVDGVVCQLIAMAFLGYRQGEGGLGVFLPSLVFLAMHLLLVGTTGSTIGHRILGLRVVRVDGGWAGPVAALWRTVLIALVVPGLIYDRDERGLHDKLPGTVLVRAR